MVLDYYIICGMFIDIDNSDGSINLIGVECDIIIGYNNYIVVLGG